MMKTVGIVTIMISVFSFGFIRFVNLKKRPEELEMFIKLITEYRTDLKWQQRTFTQVLCEFKAESLAKYFSKAAELSLDSDHLYAFTDGNVYFRELHLSAEDITVIKYFLSKIGKNSLESETTLCQKTLETLESLKTEAVSKYKKSGPLTVKLSLICGIWLAVLFV